MRVIVEAPPPAVADGMADALLDALRAVGADVVERAPVERRGVPDVPVDVLVYLADKVADGTIEGIMGAIAGALVERRRWARGRKGRTRRVVLYGPDGEELRQFEVSD